MLEGLLAMDMQPTLWVSTSLAFLVVLIATVVFHLLLVWPKNLSKHGWKYVDYAWILIAALGIIGAVGANRQTLSSALKESAAMRLESTADWLTQRVSVGTSSAVCRKFIRSEYSPPPEEFERSQREFDQQCEWFREAQRRLEGPPFSSREQIALSDLGALPPSGGDDYLFKYLQKAIEDYNTALQAKTTMDINAKQTWYEDIMEILYPWFVAVAIGLRLSKVTGEILHER
jgi:hypothetical protein